MSLQDLVIVCRGRKGREGRLNNLTWYCGSPFGNWEETVFKYALQAAKNPGVILPFGTRVTVT